MQVIEDLTIDSIEIDGYNKVFDSDTGMYIFVYDEDSIETITNNYEDYAETNNTNALATALPDLTAEITSPINNSNIMGAKNSEDKCSFNFRVINQGNESSAYEGHNFFCEIYINGTAQLGFFVTELPAFTAAPGKFDLTLNTWKDLTVGLKIDALDDVVESNENNNLMENDYFVYYCTHYSTANPKRTTSSDLLVRVDPSAVTDNITISLISGSLGAWNNITDQCSITRAVMSSSNQNENITIQGQEVANTSTSFLDYDVAGDTYYNGRRSIITLYWGVLNQASDGQIQRTIRHEIGHAFGLGHAYVGDCEYLSLMAQSSNDPLLQYTTPNWHDKYNLYALYEGEDTYSISEQNTISTNNNESNVIRTEVDYVEKLEDLEQLEDKADYIIKAKILPISENVMINDDRGYTKTKIKVTDVYEGNINIGDVIDLREPYFHITNEIGEEYDVFTGDYSKSEVGSEYILFLSKYDDADLYGLRFVSMGRYIANDNSYSTLAISSDVNGLRAQILEKYN